MEKITVSAPGSLMLLGEHAVLHGKQSIVGAINKRITIELFPRTDEKITLASGLGKHETTINKFSGSEPFSYVSESIAQFVAELPSGFDLNIKSEFSDKVGFGSSAAVTVATIAVVYKYVHQQNIDNELLFELALKVLHQIQGLGSGADLSACINGGIIAYKINLLTKKAHLLDLPHKIPLVVVYSGSKLPTKKVITIVEALNAKQPEIFTKLFDAIGECATQAIAAIIDEDWSTLGHIMNINQGLMESIGVNNCLTANIIQMLREQPGIYGAKISGSGLGDCMIGLGDVKNFMLRQIPVSIAPQGLAYE